MDENFNITDLFYESARKNPERIALIENHTKITFGEFENQVTATAAYFLEKGIRKGDRVLVFVPMSIDLYRTVLAIFRIGATAVFLDEWVSKKRMEVCCKIAGCHAFIAGFKVRFLALFSSELRKIPIHLGTKYKPKQTLDAYPLTQKTDTALITFTTGSTGVLKAAKRTHGFLHEQFKALSDVIHPQENDVSMPVLPVVLLLNLGLGITSVITRFRSGKVASFQPSLTVNQIIENRVNTIIASPFFIKALSKYLIKNNIRLAVRSIFTGGAPVFPHEAQIYVRAFADAGIEIVYGSTEAEPISSIDAASLVLEKQSELSQGLNVGKIDKNALVKIISITEEPVTVTGPEEFKALYLQHGQIGEIIVSGPHVLSEYFNNENAVRQNKIFVGDQCWHRTGDSGYIGANGNLYLTGRCSSLIQTGNRIISPFLYEGYLQTLDGVEMGTILSVQEKLKVVVELNQIAQKDKIVTAIRSLPESVQEVIFIRRIPRDPRHHSKIDYDKLKNIMIKHSLLINQ
jgi:acyl-CoA synthetase (AMP-forming)/AMP-acid ligase II